MKIILITFIFLFSSLTYAWEWNNKAFKASLKDYKNTLEQWSQNPSQVVKDFKNKYKPALETVESEISKFNYESDALPIKKYYDFFEGKYKGYVSLNEKDLFKVFTQDVSNTFNWAYRNVDAVPLIGPYKRQVEIKVDMLRFQLVPYRYMMQGALERSF